jgi:hypothetical protein
VGRPVAEEHKEGREEIVSTKQIVIFPRGQLSAKDKERASKLGVFVMEADDPSKVVQIMPSVSLPPESMLLCALEAMEGTWGDSARQRFTTNLTKLMKESKP